jgi:hypothetical protein
VWLIYRLSVPTRWGGGQRAKGRKLAHSTSGHKPSLPLPAIEKGKTEGMQDKKMPLGVFRLSGSSDTLLAAYLPVWFQLPTAVRPIEDDRRIIVLLFSPVKPFAYQIL